MKIVIVQGAFLPIPPIYGGAVEKIWFKLGEKFTHFGSEVVHISKKNEKFPDEEIINQVTHIRVKGYQFPRSLIRLKIYDFFYSIRVLKKIPKDTDVIITNTFWTPILLGIFKKNNIYVSIERMPKWQVRFYTHAFRLRANSSPVADAIKRQISPSFHNLVTLIPNPLPFEIPSTNYREKRKQILYVGRVHPEKGIDLLIHSFLKIESSYELRIVGPWEIPLGGGGNNYKQYLDSLVGTNSKIHFLGPIFDEEALFSEYKNAEIFIYPSIAEKGETFGLAPLEAMAWGCIPIVSNLPCFLDFIVHNENGLVFDYKNANAIKRIGELIKLLENNENLRKSLSIKAQKVIETHSIDTIANLFLADFQKVNNENL